MNYSGMITPEMAAWQVYEVLESRLKLYTGLWFATLNSQSENLLWTAGLVGVFTTKSLVDQLGAISKYR